jgi:hypothetical protein
MPCTYIQGLKELEEGEEVDIEVSPSILNIEENDQPDNLQGITILPSALISSSSVDSSVSLPTRLFPPLLTPHLRTHAPDSYLPILNIEENDQPDNLQGVNTEIGNHSDSSSPVG